MQRWSRQIARQRHFERLEAYDVEEGLILYLDPPLYPTRAPEIEYLVCNLCTNLHVYSLFIMLFLQHPMFVPSI